MLFSEVYGSYYRVVAAVLGEAVAGTLTRERLTKIVREMAFSESVLAIPAALREENWPLLTPDLQTPLRHRPAAPLTDLERRWLKALWADPRIRLFGPPEAGLEDVEPLYPPDAFVFFDRYADGDPYGDEGYAARFRTILTALREGRRLRIRHTGRNGQCHTRVCVPRRLEYSAKDDKFRLIAGLPCQALTVNLARVRSCELLGPYAPEEYVLPAPPRETLVLELTDERNALERAMLHFSDLEKETQRLGAGRYRVTLRYLREDETELLIRVLSFGPLLRVTEPESFIAKIRERLEKQAKLRAEG